MSDETIDTLIKILYLDPLVARGVTQFSSAKHREDVAEGGFLISSYINKLDEEIFSDIPIFSPSVAEDIWKEENLSSMIIQLLNLARLHSWAVVQFYNKAPIWRVFSERDKVEWIHDDDKNVIGVRVAYGVETKEDLIFGQNQCYLLKFREGNNKDVFAYSDLNQAMWTIATIYRQIQSQLDVMASKPEFYHIIYGTPTPAQRATTMNALDDTSVLNAFAMNKEAVEEIRVINHESYDALMDVLNGKKQDFASLTRLPLAFYKGERTSGSGTGGAAENMVELKIEKRKTYIFNIVKPIIIEIYRDRYGMTVDVEREEVEVQPITDNVNQNSDINNG